MNPDFHSFIMCLNDRLIHIFQYKKRSEMAPASAYCCLLARSFRRVSGVHSDLGAVVLVDEGITCQSVSNIEETVAVNITG